MELETKAVEHGHNHNSLEIKQAFEEFLAGFEAFKDANDARLKGLEKRGDVLDVEKVARIDAALTEQKQKLDTLMLEARRPQLAGERRAFDPALDSRLAERKAAFDRYVRKVMASISRSR
jgi:predicted phage gp36 major capsid-like protein